MQAVILAAGAAKRLRPLTDNTPKCLLKIGEKTLLQLTMDNVIDNGIKDFVFVTGYLNPMIENHVKKNYPGLNCVFLDNHDYENNNNSYSLWMTKEVVKDGMLLLDSDILFDKGIISELLNCRKDNALAVNFTHELDEEQMKVILDSDRNVKHIGKHVSLADSVGESIGIEMFSTYFVKELYSILNRKIIRENNVNEFYETSFQEVIDGSEGRNSIYAVDVSGYMCMEIDTAEDYDKAQNIFTNK
jgi:choline kinase